MSNQTENGHGLPARHCSTISETPLTEALIFPHAPGSAVLVEADDCRAIEKKLRGALKMIAAFAQCDGVTASHRADKSHMIQIARDILANVPDEVYLPASGTKACPAGDVPEVPQAQGLTPSAR